MDLEKLTKKELIERIKKVLALLPYICDINEVDECVRILRDGK